MLSDEEKKAIEYWKTHIEILHWNIQLASEHYIKVLLDLIEKQSKEIEELKEDKYGLEEEVQMQAKNIMLCEEALCEMQNKIKAKTEEVKDGTYDAKIVLQSLLEKE